MSEVYHAQQLFLFPNKQCIKCKQTFLATTDYFYAQKINKDGLCGKCKTCQRELSKQQKAKCKDFVLLTCDTCGKEFQRRKDRCEYEAKHFNRSRIYCSRQCGKNNSIEWPPTLIEEYLQGETMEDLAVKYGISRCGIKVYLKRQGIPIRKWGKRKSYYPPHKYPEHRAPHSKETRIKMSHSATKNIVEGKISPISNLERCVGEELTRRGINFTPQWGLYEGEASVICCVDFMLEDGRAIEVNGTYWHADPRKYPDGPITDSQKRKVTSDKRKRTILEHNNIPLIVLWEMDLTADFTGTIDRALSSQ